MSTSIRKEQVLALLKRLETGNPQPSNVINSGKYVQHNLAAADGIAGFRVLLELPKDSVRVGTIRVFEDGDFVFAHSEYEFFGPKIGFDIFRFEGAQIVEHWDNLQARSDQLNRSDRSLIDGPVEIVDADHTKANKAIVRAFVEDVLTHGRLDRAQAHINGENYTQHHPMIADCRSNLVGALKALDEAGTPVRYTRIHRALDEGNFALVTSETATDAESISFYDLFRVEDGKVAEPWDTVEPVPTRAEWKNDNGKF